tara:strand:- start:4442 stop:5260 length:819 start_codon:yes stop_codon:yes gene_type:complete
MARKSRELRLSQAQELAALYEEAGFAGIKKHRFITDMVTRLESRDITGGQKKFLDSLIEQGAPEVKNQERVAEIEAALAVDGMQHRQEPLESFARTLRGGWDLSEKQANFLNVLLEEAVKVQKNGKYRPSNETIEDLKIAEAKVKSSGGYYLHHRPGTAKAYDKVARWLLWNDQNQEIELLNRIGGHRLETPAEPHIDEWAVNKLLKAAKNTLEELKNPAHLPGDMRYYQGRDIALVSGEPRFHNGNILYPVIVNGEMIETYQLTKRRSRKG